MIKALTLNESNADYIAEWCGGRVVIQHDALDDSKTTHAVNVPTADGVQRAQVGDTVFRENDGPFKIFRENE